MKVIISKEEFNLMLKAKIKLVKDCYSCPIFNLEAKKNFRCKQIIYQLPDSYSTHSSGSAYPAAAAPPRRSAGNAQPPAPGGT